MNYKIISSPAIKALEANFEIDSRLAARKYENLLYDLCFFLFEILRSFTPPAVVGGVKVHLLKYNSKLLVLYFSVF